MTLTKTRYDKEGGIVAYHAYQSFAPGEATPEHAHAIGKELARRLWGGRFEVVVATHLDKAHIHCHFVINSVSFKDGKRYNDCKATYREYREMSDRICREQGLSVINDPSLTHTPRSIYIAEKDGKPTLYNIIRADVDEAISHSVVARQVYAALRQIGYEVNLSGKYIAIRLPGRERFTRLKTLGENYSEEAIQRRVLRNPLSVQYTRPLPELQRGKPAYQLRGNIQTIKRITGLQALYLHYCYRMGILPKNAPPKRVHPLLKTDLLKMDAVTAETRLLCKNHISSSAELAALKAGLMAEMKRLDGKRTKLYNMLRRAVDSKEIQEIKESRTALTHHISDIRKDLKHVSGIETRSRTIAEKLQIITGEHRQEITRQEQKHTAKKRNYYR
jgi:flagellar biosynthesis/type III secretory pathway chaperone